MVLLIKEHVYSNRCALENLAQHTDLIHSSHELAETQEYKQPVEEMSKTIYVHQREFAVLAKNDPNGFYLIGSDDATTCHILVLDNHFAIGVIHLDGGETHDSINALLQELSQYAPQNTDYDAYLVGGFLDESNRHYSRTLSNEILNLFSKLPNISFHLKLAAITTYNDHLINNIHYPMIYGICFDINTKTIRKMNFLNYGPAYRLRSIYLSVHHHCAWCIYSSRTRTITIPKFTIEQNLIDRYYRRLYKYYFHNDEQLLNMTSTSPAQERASYVQNMKKSILYILKYSKELSEWFDNQTHSIVYYWFNDQWRTDNTKIIEDIEIE